MFKNFLDMVRTCNIKGLPYSGSNMTYMGQRRKEKVEYWLDKAMANDEWKA